MVYQIGALIYLFALGAHSAGNSNFFDPYLYQSENQEIGRYFYPEQ